MSGPIGLWGRVVSASAEPGATDGASMSFVIALLPAF